MEAAMDLETVRQRSRKKSSPTLKSISLPLFEDEVIPERKHRVVPSVLRESLKCSTKRKKKSKRGKKKSSKKEVQTQLGIFLT
jgi:hypothetical protein